MMRLTAACAALVLVASPALAQDPKAASAVKAFNAVGADAGKLKVFCDMSKTMEAAGEKADAATDAKIAGYVKQLGADFETAWNDANDMDENSAGGKVVNAALDELANKCT